MSMHAIESLVEYSVITTATASPVPPLAQSICYTTVQRNYPIGSVDLNRNHSSDVLV